MTHVSVHMKMLPQETWKLHLEWDTPLPETLVKMWFEILNDFEQNLCISIHAAILMELMKKLNCIVYMHLVMHLRKYFVL